MSEPVSFTEYMNKPVFGKGEKPRTFLVDPAHVGVVVPHSNYMVGGSWLHVTGTTEVLARLREHVRT